MYSRWPQTWSPGIPWTWKTLGILKEFCSTSGKIVTNKAVLVHHSNIRVRQLLLLYCWSKNLHVEWPWWRSLLHLLIVAITYGIVSLWHEKSLENSGNIFSYFVATLTVHNSSSFIIYESANLNQCAKYIDGQMGQIAVTVYPVKSYCSDTQTWPIALPVPVRRRPDGSETICLRQFRPPRWPVGLTSTVTIALKCTVLSKEHATDRQTNGSQHCLMPHNGRGIIK